MTGGQVNWIPEDVDLFRASPSRVYDYLLGGSCNFAVDREWAEQAIKKMPWIRSAARSNRNFLRRAIDYCAKAGLSQFLDLGSGIPTGKSVHEIAQRIHPDCRVVYVDNEQVAVAHSQLLLANVPNAGIIKSDMVDVDHVLGHPVTTTLLDFTEPIVLIITAALYYVPDDDRAAETVRRYLAALPAGSMFVLSHATLEPERRKAMNLSNVLEMTRTLTSSATARPREWIRALFNGLELVEPGLVYTPHWRPDGLTLADESSWQSSVLSGVARKVE